MKRLLGRIRRIVPRPLRRYLGAIPRLAASNPIRTARQRGDLMRMELSEDQRALVRQVSTTIHHRDGMYAGNGVDYFRAGLSAVDCVDDVLKTLGDRPVRQFLDLPSGYGRELRFFIVRFPSASFTACDIQAGGVDFCASTFGCRPIVSVPQVDELELEQKFDVIWCGSLATHLDRDSNAALLRLFARHLEPDGIAVVTFHGDFVHQRIKHHGATYELEPEQINSLVAGFEAEGCGYSDYPRGQGYFDFHPSKSGYGVSLTSRSVIEGLALASGLQTEYVREQGWADHQDVYAFVKQT